MNIIRELLREVGIEPTPRDAWIEWQKIEWDRVMYGTGYGRYLNGVLVHVPYYQSLLAEESFPA